MIHFVFTDKEPRYLFLKIDDKEDKKNIKKLEEHLNLIDPICYLKTYSGPKFTQDFLFKYVQKSGQELWYASIGLWQTIYIFFKNNNIEFDGLDESKFKRKLTHTFEEFKSIVDSWNLKYTPRPYQYEAAYNILQWKKSLSSLATRAGKTMIAYIVFRYASEYLGVHRILMVVPSIDLVKQGHEDFKEYGDYFQDECLWSGGKCVESSNLTIATFQTLINYLDKKSKKYNPNFFNGNNLDVEPYDLVFVDETHRATAKSIKTIISQDFMKNVKIAFGMTGTLPKEGTIDRYCVHALLGAKIQEISPKELQDAGYISDLHIIQHRVEYADEYNMLKDWIRCAEYSLSRFVEVPNEKNPKKKDKVPLTNPNFLIAYQKTLADGIISAKWKILGSKKPSTSQMSDKEFEEFNLLRYKKYLQLMLQESTSANALHTEMMAVHFKQERVKYLIDILKECPKNTLVLAQHREYIKYVYDEVCKAFPDRHVLYVIGGAKDRKIVKQVLKENNDCIVIAGYSVMGTGITLSNLCYGVLFESFKSNVINMQSIGRGLGLSDLKDKYILHDITDCFDTKIASNKIFLQGLARCRMYKEQNWEYEVKKVTIGNEDKIDKRIIDFVYSGKLEDKEEKKKAEEKQKGALAFEEQDLFK